MATTRQKSKNISEQVVKCHKTYRYTHVSARKQRKCKESNVNDSLESKTKMCVVSISEKLKLAVKLGKWLNLKTDSQNRLRCRDRLWKKQWSTSKRQLLARGETKQFPWDDYAKGIHRKKRAKYRIKRPIMSICLHLFAFTHMHTCL